MQLRGKKFQTSNENEGGRKSTNHSLKFNKRRNDRMKRPLRDLFSCVAILQNVDLASDSYWLYSGAVVSKPIQVFVTKVLVIY